MRVGNDAERVGCAKLGARYCGCGTRLGGERLGKARLRARAAEGLLSPPNVLYALLAAHGAWR